MRFSWYLRISHLSCFFWGNPCISTHYPSPFSWNLSTPSHLWEVKTHQVSFGWMVCSFCRPFFAVSLVPPFLLRQDIAQEADLQWFPLRLSTASSIDQQRTTGENTAVPRFTSVRELMPRRCRGFFYVDSLMSQDLRHNSLTFLTIVSKGLQFWPTIWDITVVWRTECKEETPLPTGENASNFKMVHMWEREWPGWHFGTLLSCDHCQSDEFFNFRSKKTPSLESSMRMNYFCKPLSSLFLVFVLEICQFPRLVTSLELPCCFFWVELVLIHLNKIIESLRHPKHFNIFGVAEVAVCLVVPWKLNVTYMERVMRLKNSIVTYPSFQE